MAAQVDLIVSARQIATVPGGSAPRTGAAMQQLQVIEKGAIAVKGGRIVAVAESVDVHRHYQAHEERDFPDSCVTAGLVDCHTHLVFAGSRENDFYERLRGVSYEDIAKRGGGILQSVRHLRAASESELEVAALKRLRILLSHGTTTCEIKSGYGLTHDDELKTLHVIDRLAKMQPVAIVPTFLGAHEFPEEFRADHEGYIRLLCDTMLPEIAELRLARYCDIFVEKNVYSIEESRRILRRAREVGFELKLHADELAEGFGGAELAAEMQAVSADHLVMISEGGMEALARAGTLAVLLPATTFFLGKSRFAPARRMLEKNLAVALATDLNPGSSNTESLQAVMTLAAVHLKMSPEEILTAVTHNAACAIGESKRVGRLLPSMQADLVVWDMPDFKLIPYHFGGNRVLQVYKAGEVVWHA